MGDISQESVVGQNPRVRLRELEKMQGRGIGKWGPDSPNFLEMKNLREQLGVGQNPSGITSDEQRALHRQGIAGTRRVSGATLLPPLTTHERVRIVNANLKTPPRSPGR